MMNMQYELSKLFDGQFTKEKLHSMTSDEIIDFIMSYKVDVLESTEKTNKKTISEREWLIQSIISVYKSTIDEASKYDALDKLVDFEKSYDIIMSDDILILLHTIFQKDLPYVMATIHWKYFNMHGSETYDLYYLIHEMLFEPSPEYFFELTKLIAIEEKRGPTIDYPGDSLNFNQFYYFRERAFCDPNLSEKYIDMFGKFIEYVFIANIDNLLLDIDHTKEINPALKKKILVEIEKKMNIYKNVWNKWKEWK
jgi:hypothetical protein